VLLAGLFLRLGVWQLSRLEERKADNARRRAEIRRETVVGTPDYANERVIKRRSMNGSPGVHIVTPVVISARDTLFVNRGWVYAADAATVDLTRWREARDRFSGYMAAMPGTTTQYLISRDSAGPAAPVRLPEPDFGNGPHLSYAIQWFCFAAIALVGAAVVVRKARGLPMTVIPKERSD
jgi:surfeit locus 1 family protein